MNASEEVEISNSSNKSRRVWAYQETKALLDAYGRRKDEFVHPRRKKFAWQNVAEDLGSSNLLSEPVSALMCENKLKSLLRAFKQATDNGNQTGAGRIYVPFEKELDELFGSRPIVAHSHTLALHGAQVSALPTSQGNDSGASSSMASGSKRKRDGDYLEKKLAMKQEYYDKKLKLQAQAHEDKERRHKEKMELLSKLAK